MKELFGHHANAGKIQWIGIRKEKKMPLVVLQSAIINIDQGLVGDHYKGSKKNRQVTLIQAEHLAVVATIMGKKNIDPSLLRRNIVVSGLNLLALKERQFRIGKDVILECTGNCHPCSRMEANLGYGGYNAMRGHGGITARVIQEGSISLGDSVTLLEQ